jgi:hypothetical protein
MALAAIAFPVNGACFFSHCDLQRVAMVTLLFSQAVSMGMDWYRAGAGVHA